MIIKQFSLKNFGRHEELVFESDAHVVGLLGPNGVGKSTVLDAIEFAITGETRDQIASYVRHGEGNASVSMVFLKNGMEGYIFRQFGKTTKRKLVWDGRTITAAKEVDATMAEIFGADKKAIANAVFINQGMLDKILFSKESERRDLFVRLVNMSFCEQRATVIDGKIKKLQTTLVDLGPALDLAAESLRQADEVHQKAKAVFEAMPDYQAAVKFCEQFLRTSDQLNITVAQIAETENALRVHQSQLSPLLQAWEVVDYEAAEQRMEAWETARQTLENTFHQWRTTKMAITHYSRISRDISEKMRQQQEYQRILESLNPYKWPAAQFVSRLETLRISLERQKVRVAWLSDLEETNQKVAVIKQEQATLKAPRESEEQLQTRQAQLSELNATEAALKGFLDKQLEFSRCEQMKQPRPEGGVQCVHCGLIVSNPEALTEAGLSGLRRALEAMRQQRQELVATYRELNDEFNAWRKRHEELANALSYWLDRSRQLSENLKTVEVENTVELQAEFDDLQSRHAQIPGTETAISQCRRDIEKMVKDRSNLNLDQETLRSANKYTDQEAKRFQLEVDAHLADIKTRREQFGSISRLHGSLTGLQQQQANLLIAKQNQERVLNLPAPKEVTELSASLDGNMAAVNAELQARQEARFSASGQMVQAKSALEKAEADRAELLRRREADEGKRKLIEDLVVLRNLLRADGLPTAVVQYHFGYLAVLTQNALNQLDANFSIQIDPKDTLSFMFQRLDESEHAPLPMHKLSGGQRVRLCTAFLIAVQQRLVKEVGLLVLDEPSTHIDQTGVESLAELLMNLGTQLQNTEIQIFVSDHHPSLKDCFNRVLTMK